MCTLESGEFPGLLLRRMQLTTMSKLWIVWIYKIKVALRGKSFVNAGMRGTVPFPLYKETEK